MYGNRAQNHCLLLFYRIPVLYAREHVPLAVANMGSPGAQLCKAHMMLRFSVLGLSVQG